MDRILFYLVSIATLMLIKVNVSADPTPCCWPAQWEGVFDQKAGLFLQRDNYVTLADAIVVTHVDYGRQMIVNEMVLFENNITQKQIMDYKKQVVYIIMDQKCQVEKLQGPMGDSCVPENANYLGERNILGVTADVWFVSNMNGTSNVTTARLTVTRDNCYPIQSVYVGINTADYSYCTIDTAENVTAGIVNPSIFNVPPICNQTANHQESPYKTFVQARHFFRYV